MTSKLHPLGLSENTDVFCSSQFLGHPTLSLTQNANSGTYVPPTGYFPERCPSIVMNWTGIRDVPLNKRSKLRQIVGYLSSNFQTATSPPTSSYPWNLRRPRTLILRRKLLRDAYSRCSGTASGIRLLHPANCDIDAVPVIRIVRALELGGSFRAPWLVEDIASV